MNDFAVVKPEVPALTEMLAQKVAKLEAVIRVHNNRVEESCNYNLQCNAFHDGKECKDCLRKWRINNPIGASK